MKLEDVVKAQRDFVAGVKRRVEAVAKAEQARPERVLRDQEDRLAQLQAELQVALKARETALRRFDEDIARKREAIAARQRELKNVKEAVETEQKRSAPKPDRAQRSQRQSPGS